MIETLQTALASCGICALAVMSIIWVAVLCGPAIRRDWAKFRNRGVVEQCIIAVALANAIVYGAMKPVQNAGTDEGIALVGISVEYDGTNNVTAVEVKFTGSNVTTATPVSVRNAETEQWRGLVKVNPTVTTDLPTNVLAFAVAGNAATNRYWWVGVDTPAVIIESQGITITNYVATSKSVRIDWTCDDPKATVFAVQRKRKKPADIPYDAEVEYLETPRSFAYTDVKCLIYTGLSPTLGTEFEVKCRFRRTGQITDYGNIVFGMRYTYGSQWRCMISNYKSYNDGSGYASFWNNARCPSYRPSLGTVDYVFAYHNGVFTDGHGNSSQIAASGTPPVSPMPTDWQIYLFCGQNLDTSARPDHASDPFDGRLYYAKFWQNGVLVRDYIAVRKNGVGYMYDRVSKSLYGNAGTGAFEYGSDTLSYDWETVDTTSANTSIFEGFTVGEDWEWRITSTYTEGNQ